MAKKDNFWTALGTGLKAVAESAAAPFEMIRDIGVSGNEGITQNVGKLLDRKQGEGGGGDALGSAAAGFAAGGPAGAAMGLLGSLFSGGGGNASQGATAPAMATTQPQGTNWTPIIIGGGALLVLLLGIAAVAALSSRKGNERAPGGAR